MADEMSDRNKFLTETLEDVFTDYVSMVYPGDWLHPSQLREVRLAFYAGVWHSLNSFKRIADDDIPESWGVAKMERMNDGA